MTTGDKQLLLKDLCGRLPYHPRIKIYNDSWEGCQEGEFDSNLYFHHIEAFLCDRIEILPYLRPIKSMTQEECNELFRILNIDENNSDWLKINDIGVIRLFTKLGKDFYEIADAIDYLYSIHVDFRGMIEKGLALKAPEGMYK